MPLFRCFLAEGAAIAWVDQCGLRSDAAPPGRSWAPEGRTPIARVTEKRIRVNVMSAVASRGAQWFTVFTERFTAPVFTTFLDRVARQVHVIAGRHPVHRSKAVRAWPQDNSDRIEPHLMPATASNSTPANCSTPTSNATSTPPAPTPPTAWPTRPDASCTAANASRTSSAATSGPRTSATPSCRQPNIFGSNITEDPAVCEPRPDSHPSAENAIGPRRRKRPPFLGRHHDGLCPGRSRARRRVGQRPG
ncbi:transposase [Saccharothrix stipae]